MPHMEIASESHTGHHTGPGIFQMATTLKEEEMIKSESNDMQISTWEMKAAVESETGKGRARPKQAMVMKHVQ